jgi:hypothetical protein
MEPGDVAYIVENKMRVTRCTVVSVEADRCVIRFEKGGGCRLWKKRLYPTKELAEAAVEYIPKTEEKKEEVKREYTPWG